MYEKRERTAIVTMNRPQGPQRAERQDDLRARRGVPARRRDDEVGGDRARRVQEPALLGGARHRHARA